MSSSTKHEDDIVWWLKYQCMRAFILMHREFRILLNFLCIKWMHELEEKKMMMRNIIAKSIFVISTPIDNSNFCRNKNSDHIPVFVPNQNQYKVHTKTNKYWTLSHIFGVMNDWNLFADRNAFISIVFECVCVGVCLSLYVCVCVWVWW